MYKIIPLFLFILITVFSCSTSADISSFEVKEVSEVKQDVDTVTAEPLLTVVDTPKEYVVVDEVVEGTLDAEVEVPATAVAPVGIDGSKQSDIDSIITSRTISLMGYEIRIVAYDGYALVEYPTIVTNEDITDAIGVLISTYPGVFDDVYYELISPGSLRVVYPYGIPADVLNKTMDGLAKDLEYYVTMLFADDAPVLIDEPVDVAEASGNVVISPVETIPEEAAVIPTVVDNDDIAIVKEEAATVENVATVDVIESGAAFPTPILDDTVSPTLLKILSVIIVSTVIFTVSVAIRGANKLKLQKSISIALSLLFPALSIVISTLVAGWSNVWLIYLVLLLTYFIFRAEWRGQSHF